MSDARAQLDQLSANLAELVDVPSRVATAAAGRINELIQDEFASGQDPYGTAWEELAESTVQRKGGDDRILIRTGETQAETYARPTAGAGIEVVSTEAAGFHQTGTVHMPARPVLPGDHDGLPEEWEEAIDDETEKAFAKVRA